MSITPAKPSAVIQRICSLLVAVDFVRDEAGELLHQVVHHAALDDELAIRLLDINSKVQRMHQIVDGE